MILLLLCIFHIQSLYTPHFSCHQAHIVAKEATEALTRPAWAWLSEQSAALVHYTHMITWPFPPWMSLIRSHWRIHWVCNCFPLGEMLTAIESHLTAEFADECTLSTEWSRLIRHRVVMELLKIPKPPEHEGGAEFLHLYCTVGAKTQMLLYSLKWLHPQSGKYLYYSESVSCSSYELHMCHFTVKSVSFPLSMYLLEFILQHIFFILI